MPILFSLPEKNEMKQMRLLTAEQMAHLLGLEGGSGTPDQETSRSDLSDRGRVILVGQPMSEEQRHDIVVNMMMPLLDAASEAEREAVIARFCALYLPKLVDAFLTPPSSNASHPDAAKWGRHLKISGPYFEMMRTIMRSPYFTKFILSEHPIAARGTLLGNRLAQQLADEALQIDKDIRREGNTEAVKRSWERFKLVLDFFTVVLALRAERKRVVPLPNNIKLGLSRILYYWGETCDRSFLYAASFLAGDGKYEDFRTKTKDTLEGLQTCARKGCTAVHDLHQCVRCKTVLYCGPVHQLEHWKDPVLPHRLLCYETTY